MKKILVILLACIGSVGFAQIFTPEVNVTSTTNGWIGIGTDQPTRLLELYDPNSVAPIRMTSGRVGGANSHIEYLNSFSTYVNTKVSLGNWNSSAGRFSVSLGDGTANPTEMLTLTNSGFLGLGTTSPNALLDIHQGSAILSTPNQSIGNGTNLNGISWIVDDNSAGRVLEEAAAIRFLGTGTWNGSVSPSVLSFETIGSAGGGTVQRMVIDNSGKVGIGTSSPSYKLDVSTSESSTWAARVINTHPSAGSGLLVRSDNAGAETTTLGVYANGDYRFMVKSSGKIGIGSSAPVSTLSLGTGTSTNRETNGITLGKDQQVLEFIHSTYSSGYGSKLYGVDESNGVTSLRIAVRGQSSSWTDAIYVRAATSAYARVGIGTNSPGYKFDVNGTLRATTVIESSDERLKENISNLSTQNLDLIRARQYNLKEDGSFHYGVIAQEVEKIFPHMVSTDEQGMKSVAYTEFIPLLIEKVKEQDDEIRKLRNQVSSIQEMEARISQLEKILIQSKIKKDE